LQVKKNIQSAIIFQLVQLEWSRPC
jgi:hypothetical protein